MCKEVPLTEICIRNIENYPNMFICVEATTNHLIYTRMWKDEIKHRLSIRAEKEECIKFQWLERLKNLEEELVAWLDCLQLLLT